MHTEHKMNIPRLGTIILILGMLGCSTTTIVQNDLPCPERYQPILIPEGIQRGTAKAIRGLMDDDTDAVMKLRINIIADHEESLQKELLTIAATNKLGFKQNIKDLEVLANCTR